MPIIDGKIRNPSHRRYYGLDVGDRVRWRYFRNESYRYGTVVELGFMDNNRAYVTWDDDPATIKKPEPVVAEWMIRLNKDGNPMTREEKTEEHFIYTVKEECEEGPDFKLKDERFNELIQAYEISDQKAMDWMVKNKKIVRVPDGWIYLTA